jgi:predicted PurR-regulated permease PerM
MATLRQRRYALAGLLVGVAILTAAVLWEVVEVVFFAITVAYVLFPLRKRLVDRGLTRRVASAIVTTTAFLVVVLLLAPIVWALFRRRGDIAALLANLPDTLPITVAGFTYVVDVAALAAVASRYLRSLALDLAAAAPFLVLELAMFAIVLYGLMVRPGAVGDAVYGIIPQEYHDIVQALNTRVSGTLYALYVIQAATAVLTFPVAFVVFYALGYEDAFVLSVVAGIFQFIPILGPGVLALGLAGADLVAGMTQRAILVATSGPVVIGLVPDLIVRPQLASRRAKLPVSLYFVGFTGGVLTLGAIGIIAGPLIVAVLIEVVHLLIRDPAVPDQ